MITFATLIQIILGLCGVVAALLWAVIRGGSERRDQNEELEKHERMNDADLGIGATDSERIERLREFAAKHGDRPAKGKSR